MANYSFKKCILVIGKKLVNRLNEQPVNLIDSEHLYILINSNASILETRFVTNLNMLHMYI